MNEKIIPKFKIGDRVKVTSNENILISPVWERNEDGTFNWHDLDSHKHYRIRTAIIKEVSNVQNIISYSLHWEDNKTGKITWWE